MKNQCQYCLSHFETEDKLTEHLINAHYSFNEEHHENVKDSLIHLIYEKYYLRAGEKQHRWIASPKNERDYHVRVKIRNSDRYLDANYFYDMDTHIWRLYTDDLKYGNNIEIIFCNETGNLTVKGLQQMRKKWNEEHGIKVKDMFDIEIMSEVDLLEV